MSAVLALDASELEPRFAQLGCSFPKGVFQRGHLHVELDMETPHLEEIGDAQKDFQLVERLEQEIGRARA